MEREFPVDTKCLYEGVVVSIGEVSQAETERYVSWTDQYGYHAEWVKLEYLSPLPADHSMTELERLRSENAALQGRIEKLEAERATILAAWNDVHKVVVVGHTGQIREKLEALYFKIKELID